MALGYEGVISVVIGANTYYALGTGTSVPRARSRLESSSGYGGTIKNPAIPPNTMGIGEPHNYDWEIHDGSLNFEMSKDFLTNAIKPRLFDRQVAFEALFRSRKDNVQDYKTCYWNNINFSASEGAAVDGSMGFVALTREPYVWGDKYIDNKQGMGLLCPLDVGMPPPLNPSGLNKNPIPFWNTKVYVKPAGGGSTLHNFTNWSLDFSQEIVKFFGCTRTSPGVDPGAQAPLYLAAGPMTVTFSGSLIIDFDVAPTGFLGDNLDELKIYIDTETITLKRLESTTESDDVQTGDSFVPLTVEYAAYEIAT